MDIFDKMKARWPSAAVAQTKLGQFSGGLINPRTLANLNSLWRGMQKHHLAIFIPTLIKTRKHSLTSSPIICI